MDQLVIEIIISNVLQYSGGNADLLTLLHVNRMFRKCTIKICTTERALRRFIPPIFSLGLASEWYICGVFEKIFNGSSLSECVLMNKYANDVALMFPKLAHKCGVMHHVMYFSDFGARWAFIPSLIAGCVHIVKNESGSPPLRTIAAYGSFQVNRSGEWIAFPNCWGEYRETDMRKVKLVNGIWMSSKDNFRHVSIRNLADRVRFFVIEAAVISFVVEVKENSTAYAGRKDSDISNPSLICGIYDSMRNA